MPTELPTRHLHIELDEATYQELNTYLEYGDRKAVFLPLVNMLLDLFKRNVEKKRFLVAAIESGFLKFTINDDVTKNLRDFKLEESPNAGSTF